MPGADDFAPEVEGAFAERLPIMCARILNRPQ